MTSETDWTFVPAELDAFLSDKGHNALLGIRYHAHGPGWVELAMAWQEGLVGDEGEGSLASGPMMTLTTRRALRSTSGAVVTCHRSRSTCASITCVRHGAVRT